MGEVQLTVPAYHREAFRQATAIEVEQDGDWIKGNASAIERTLAADPAVKAARLEDVESAIRILNRDAALLRTLNEAGEGEVVLSADPETFSHIAETMAHKVIAPQITAEAEISPCDDEQAEKLIALADALEWAAKTGRAMHREREHEAVAA